MSSQSNLKDLYPFLYGEAQPETLEAALLAAVAEKARDSRETNARAFEDQARVLVAAAKSLAGVYRHGGRLFTMGNGGSSCDAAHIAVEFLHPVTAGRPALAATNLVADLAMLSAVGNDLGFEHVFLIAAFAKAKELGMVTVGLAGGDGGKMKSRGLVDHCLVVPSSSIHRIQECHVACYHILWDLVHTLLADDRGFATTKGASA
jgi:D-sedoheptulose 7-phosphate isomerase